MMTVEELAELCSEVRHAQKEYFRTRSQTALAKSKMLEAKLDQCVDRVMSKQKRLFDE